MNWLTDYMGTALQLYKASRARRG